jgi:sugar fermentation stimulation protein A
MKIDFESSLIPGTLVKRYKRFLADVKLSNGEVITAHCTNSGSMKSCIEEGADVFLSPVSDPNRKTQFTWEMIRISGNWVGINTSVPNRVAYQWVKDGVIPGLEDYTSVKREVTYGDSRFDLYAEREGEKCFIEVKNVTLKDDDFARFPDAKTTRGQKHLETLIRVKNQGMRAVMLYIIQRIDVSIFAPAWDIDPQYSETLVKAHSAGVEVIPFQVQVSPNGITPLGIMPFRLAK